MALVASPPVTPENAPASRSSLDSLAVLADRRWFCWLCLSGYYGWLFFYGLTEGEFYRTESLRGLRLEDVLPATLKTTMFGYLIGTTGCYFGMHAKGGTEGVGRAATRSVVVAVFLVLTSNVLLVRLIQIFA